MLEPIQVILFVWSIVIVLVTSVAMAYIIANRIFDPHSDANAWLFAGLATLFTISGIIITEEVIWSKWLASLF